MVWRQIGGPLDDLKKCERVTERAPRCVNPLRAPLVTGDWRQAHQTARARRLEAFTRLRPGPRL